MLEVTGINLKFAKPAIAAIGGWIRGCQAGGKEVTERAAELIWGSNHIDLS